MKCIIWSIRWLSEIGKTRKSSYLRWWSEKRNVHQRVRDQVLTSYDYINYLDESQKPWSPFNHTRNERGIVMFAWKVSWLLTNLFSNPVNSAAIEDTLTEGWWGKKLLATKQQHCRSQWVQACRLGGCHKT